ncbi:metallopeptidase TldD-related protein [Enterococcus faecalis]
METFETDIRLFIFRKREVIKINEITDIRWTEYFRMVFLHNETSTYEDYDISLLLNLESFIELIQRKEQEFIKLIKLPILKENIDINLYDWLFMHAIGGYFIHETVGHLLEMDNKGTYRLDQVVAGKFLDVIDTFYDYENLIGLNKYDDNGIRLEAIKLITKGTIKNFWGIEEV